MRTGTLALLAGALLALSLPAPPLGHACAGIAVALLFAVRVRRVRLPALLVVGLLWTGLGARVALEREFPAVHDGSDLTLTVVIDDLPVRSGARVRMRVRVVRADGGPPGALLPRGSRALLSWYGWAPDPRAGERWRLRARLRAPRGLVNPGGFDFRAHALSSGVSAVGYVRESPDNVRLATAPWWSLAAWRERLAVRLDAVAGPGAARAIIKAVALGVREEISDRQWSTLRETGTAHLMAISGLHVGLVAWLAAAVAAGAWSRSAWLASRFPAPRVALLVALAAAFGYAALAGFSVPTRRALVMLAVLVLARLRGRHVAPSTVLALACTAVLALDPLAVGSAGFWLSFSAVAAIAFGVAGRLAPVARDGPLRRLWWRWGRVHPLVALGVAPASLLLLGEGAPIAPLANALAVPWVSMLVVPPALVATLLAIPWPAAAAGLCAVAGEALAHLWPALEWLGDLVDAPGPARPPPLAVAGGCVGFVLAALPGPVRVRWLAACWILPLVLWRAPSLPAGALEVTVLDVGQGLAVTARSATGVLVYDAGPRWRGGFDAGRQIVARALRAEGIARVDTLVVSHGDLDHAGGVRGLRASVDVERTIGDAAFRAGPGVPCRHGSRWGRDGLRFTLARVRGSGSGNDRSCVLRIDTPSGSVLMPGDVEAGAEAELTPLLADAAPVALLVAPHHGSATSSSAGFLAALRPREVAIPAGYRNRFGFPHPDVVARLESTGATLRSTGQCGAIRYRFVPGEPVRIRCWRAGRRGPWQEQDDDG